MPNNLEIARARRAQIEPELLRLGNLPGRLSGPQHARWKQLTTEYDDLDEKIADLEVRERGARIPPLQVDDLSRRDLCRDAVLRNVESREVTALDYVRNSIVEAIDQEPSLARAMVARSSPAYLTAFSKLVRDPKMGFQEWTPEERNAWVAVRDEQRASLLESGSAAAGVPTILDPVWTVTGAGNVNNVRALATIKRTTSNNYHGVSAAQVSSSWDTEGSAVSDDSPTLVDKPVTVFMARCYINASFEVFEDLQDVAAEISKIFMDSKSNLEASAFATGSGSGEPTGIVTALAAVTASRVSPATGGAYALADPYALQAALPARFSPGASWLASLTTINKTRRFGEGTTGSNSAFWADLGGGVPPQLLGRPISELSPMSTSYTTGQSIMVYSDLTKYWICDHVRGTQIDFQPIGIDQATGRPNATRGYLLTWRTGANFVDVDAGRVLRLWQLSRPVATP